MINQHLLDDSALLYYLKQGDNKAFESIYKKHWQKIYLIAYKKLQSKEVAEELTQSIFVSLWERRLELDVKELENYLSTAIKYKIINYIDATILRDRIFGNIKNTFNNDIAPDSESILAVKEIRDSIEKALSGLPAKTQTIFRLSRFENFSIREIAANMNMNEKAVEYHITQSLKTMRIHLKDFIVTASAIAITLHQ
jgi:RNA polymerase sigma-70 factor (ECF subfamily)